MIVVTGAECTQCGWTGMADPSADATEDRCPTCGATVWLVTGTP